MLHAECDALHTLLVVVITVAVIIGKTQEKSQTICIHPLH